MTNKSGFTLVEIIVAISITLIIATIGIASFVELNRRQLVDQSTKKILADIRLAQNMALSQQKPDSGTCTSLTGYTFTLSSVGNIYSYTIDPVCSPAFSDPSWHSKSVTGIQGVAITGFSKLTFGRGTTAAQWVGGNTLTITSSVSSITRTITVGQGGDITVQ